MLLAAYGFVPPQANRHDRLRLPASEGLPALSGAALKATLASHRGRWSATPELLEAALLSLPLHRRPPPPPAEEARAARALLDWLAQVAAADFATPLEADEVTISELERGAPSPSEGSEERGVEGGAGAGAGGERGEGRERGEGGEAAAGGGMASRMHGAAWAAPVLRYRVQRKRLWRVAEEVLRAHLAEQLD